MTTGDAAREVWLLMSDLVLDNQRRREVSDALGHELRPRARGSPARAPADVDGRARRRARHRPAQRDAVVDDLEAQGLVRRRPHPTDGRAKLVEATRKGKELARRADEILATPPPALSTLSPHELETLRRILQGVAGSPE